MEVTREGFVSRQLWQYAISPELLAQIRICNSIEEMEQIVGQILADLGFVMATYHLLRVNGHGDRLLTFFSSYPNDWLNRYVEKGYLFHDVIHDKSRKSVVPFSWKECQQRELPEKAGTIFCEASEFNIRDGFSVPIHGPNAFAVFSAVAEGSAKERANSIEFARGALTLLGLSIHERALTLLADDVVKHSQITPRLSPRELECLRWVAAGKNTSMISEILLISNNTVEAHVQSVMRKLNAQTRAHAVIKAISLGLIALE
jgi:DNA-binding CsgD family transcriptional regulator